MTLIEVLVALAIVGILGSVAAPSFRELMQNSQRSADTNEVLMALLMARSESVTRGSRVTVCKVAASDPTSCDDSSSWQNGFMVFADDDGDSVRDEDEDVVLSSTSLGANTVVTSSEFSNNISYFPSGISSNNGTFNVCVNGLVASNILVSATGRPRAVEAACP